MIETTQIHDRFLYPPAADRTSEAVENPDFESGASTGWGTGGGSLTLSVHSDARFRGSYSMKINLDVVAGNPWARYRVRPPRGLFVPQVRRLVGPYDTLANNLAASVGTVKVSNPSRWPNAGTASFEHSLRNASGADPIEEIAWSGKSGDSLLNVQRNLRNEDNQVLHQAGEALVGTSYLRRFLWQIWVMAGTSSTGVMLSMHPRYDTGSGYGFAGTGVAGPAVPLIQGEWSLVELIHEHRGTNVAAPAGNEPDEMEVRIHHLATNPLNAELWVDEAHLYHLHELDPRPIDGRPDVIEDVGEAFERTAGGNIRSARVRPRTRSHLLAWDSRRNPLPSQQRDFLKNWHRDLCYPEGAPSRSFDYAALEGQVGSGYFPLPQAEVVWADSAPIFTEGKIGEHWGTALQLLYRSNDTAGIGRAGLK